MQQLQVTCQDLFFLYLSHHSPAGQHKKVSDRGKLSIQLPFAAADNGPAQRMF